MSPSIPAHLFSQKKAEAKTNVSVDTAIPNRTEITRANTAFAGFVLLSIIICWSAFRTLAIFSFQHESSSHVVLIPLISIYLLYTERGRIFQVIRPSIVPGGSAVLAALIFYFLSASQHSTSDPGQSLTSVTLAMVVLWWGGFLLCYGATAWREATFSLLFLLLMVPLPPALLDSMVYYLQRGSTEVSYLLFRLVGIPVLREGFILNTPHQSIEVAKECSGIRSSLALFITCLLAAHLFLRTKWKMLVFVLLAFPLAILKNGIRITTLTLLAVYVDPSFLTGSLHHDGGFVFFFLALAILAPILLLLQKSERQSSDQNSGVPLKMEDGLAPGQ
jgi:exosortase